MAGSDSKIQDGDEKPALKGEKMRFEGFHKNMLHSKASVCSQHVSYLSEHPPWVSLRP